MLKKLILSLSLLALANAETIEIKNQTGIPAENLVQALDFFSNYCSTLGKFFTGLSDTYNGLNASEKQEAVQALADVAQEFHTQYKKHKELFDSLASATKEGFMKMQLDAMKSGMQIKVPVVSENVRENDINTLRYSFDVATMALEHAFKFYEELFVFVRKLDNAQKNELVEIMYDFSVFFGTKSQNVAKKFHDVFARFQKDMEKLKKI